MNIYFQLPLFIPIQQTYRFSTEETTYPRGHCNCLQILLSKLFYPQKVGKDHCFGRRGRSEFHLIEFMSLHQYKGRSMWQPMAGRVQSSWFTGIMTATRKQNPARLLNKVNHTHSPKGISLTEEWCSFLHENIIYLTLIYSWCPVFNKN